MLLQLYLPSYTLNFAFPCQINSFLPKLILLSTISALSFCLFLPYMKIISLLRTFLYPRVKLKKLTTRKPDLLKWHPQQAKSAI